jgi:hypothetical protein
MKYLFTSLVLSFACLNIGHANEGCLDIYKKVKRGYANAAGLSLVAPVMTGTILGKAVENSNSSDRETIKNVFVGTTLVSGASALALTWQNRKINRVVRILEASLAGDLDDERFQKFSQEVIEYTKKYYDIQLDDYDVNHELMNMNNEQMLCPVNVNGNKLRRRFLTKKEVIKALAARISQSYSNIEISCVDSASFKRIDDQVHSLRSCNAIKKSLNAALEEQRNNAKLKAHIKNNKLLLMGDYIIDGNTDSIYFNEEISSNYSNGPVVGYQASAIGNEIGIEVEYESDNHPLAPLGGNAIVGEMGGVDMVCYDVQSALKKYGCGN